MTRPLQVKVTWTQVYRGNKRSATKLKKDYKERGYFTRLRNHTSYYTLEIGEAVEYNWERKAQ